MRFWRYFLTQCFSNEKQKQSLRLRLNSHSACLKVAVRGRQPHHRVSLHHWTSKLKGSATLKCKLILSQKHSRVSSCTLLAAKQLSLSFSLLAETQRNRVGPFFLCETTKQPVLGLTGDSVPEWIFASLGSWEQTAHYF